MLEMINFVFPIFTFMVSSSKWGSDSASGDDGHGDGPYVLWCNFGCRGSWISRALTTV